MAISAPGYSRKLQLVQVLGRLLANKTRNPDFRETVSCNLTLQLRT